MYGQISEIVPKLYSVKGLNSRRSEKLYSSHTLYVKHWLYHLGTVYSDTMPIMGYIENKTPKLYSIVND